jgi:taurine dioxygenase
MSSSTISIQQLAPAIGAEVAGVDLTSPLTDAQIETIGDALLKHLVIFFRDQDLTPAQHKAFGRRFGNLHIHPAPLGILNGDAEVIIVEADEHSRRIAGESGTPTSRATLIRRWLRYSISKRCRR